jgi:ABC-type glutathione transport system ATPase component
MAKVLQISNLSVWYHSRLAVKNLNLEINENELVVVLGENGSGKTTIANAIAGFLPDYAKIEGKFTIGDLSVDATNYNAYKRRLGQFARINKLLAYMPQEPFEILDPLYKLKDQISEPIFYSQRDYLINRIIARENLTSKEIAQIKEASKKGEDALIKLLANEPYLLEQFASLFRYEASIGDIGEAIDSKLSRRYGWKFFFIKNYSWLKYIPILRQIANREIKREAYEAARELAYIFNLREEYLSMYPSQLSGGLRQLGTLAAALASKPSLILMDEPTSNLDALAQFNLFNGIVKIKKTLKKSFFIISHEPTLIDISDRVLILRNGEIVAQGTKAELLKSNDEYVRKILRV